MRPKKLYFNKHSRDFCADGLPFTLWRFTLLTHFIKQLKGINFEWPVLQNHWRILFWTLIKRSLAVQKKHCKVFKHGFCIRWSLGISTSSHFLLESHALENLAFGDTRRYQDIQTMMMREPKEWESMTVIGGTSGTLGSVLSFLHVLAKCSHYAIK